MMERLTYNEVLAKQYYPNENIDNEEIFNKLGKLEDIEQELGIPLEVLFKALKDGIWYEHKYYGVQFCDFVNLLDGGYWRLSIVNPKDDFEHDLDLGLEDYGKTWALTREELEND